MIVNCIAIDDEPLALGLIKSFIEMTPFLNLVGWYSNGAEALRYLQVQKVDLVFLDIKMPILNGIDLARMLYQNDEITYPRVVFTTAHHQFAIESYKIDALYYLLKPFGYDDFLRAANKALNFYEKRSLEKTDVQNDEVLFVRVGHQMVKIFWEEILFIEGLRDYVMIHIVGSSKPVVTLVTMKLLEEKLPPNKFMRVQRSFIVALKMIRAISKSTLWIGEAEIPISERNKAAIQMLFQAK